MASPILPDDLWKRLEPFIPKPKENRHVRFAGRKPTEPRQVLTGILFVLRTGIPWRWLPATSDFPSGQTCRRHLQGRTDALFHAHHRRSWHARRLSPRVPCLARLHPDAR